MHFSISAPDPASMPNARRAEAGQPEWFGEDDLYPDVRPCMTALRDMSVWIGVAGNQTSRAGELLRKLDLPANLIATSEEECARGRLRAAPSGPWQKSAAWRPFL
jgi:hypothetical protein